MFRSRARARVAITEARRLFWLSLSESKPQGDETRINASVSFSMQCGLILMAFCLRVGVYGDGDEVKSVSVMEGDSVTLHTDVTHIEKDLEIEWRFRDKRIARIKRSINVDPSYDNETEIFRGKLKMNNQTGDLTITHITTQHNGVYKLNIFTGNQQKIKTFSLTAHAPLPIPVITSGVSHCSSSKCVLLCSVVNVRHVTLSWFNGSNIQSSISVSDLNVRLSLPLEVDYEDTHTYTCVLNNPISNETKHFCLADLCRPCSDVEHGCDSVEPLMRLVVTAVMGVAAVAAVIVLGYDIRSRRDEHKRKSTTTTSDE